MATSAFSRRPPWRIRIYCIILLLLTGASRSNDDVGEEPAAVDPDDGYDEEEGYPPSTGEVAPNYELPDNWRFCTMTTYDGNDLECTDNPMAVRLEHAADADERQMISRLTFGVVQRIDGNNAEKEAVRKVIKDMTYYYHAEVLSNPAYKDVRFTCINQHELCSFWAAVDECDKNRIYMVMNCPLACRYCLLAQTALAPIKFPSLAMLE